MLLLVQENLQVVSSKVQFTMQLLQVRIIQKQNPW